MLSTTSVAEAALCLKKFQYDQIDRLAPLPQNVPPRVRRGLWVHKAIHDTVSGQGWIESLTASYEWALNHGVDQVKAQAIYQECFDLLLGYFDYWNARPDAGWDVVSSETQIIKQVSPDLRLRATVDRIVRLRQMDLLAVVETKTTEQIPSADWRQIDPQTALQFALCRLNGIDVQVIVFDYLLTKRPTVPRVLKNGTGFYASDTKTLTTTVAFERAVTNLSAVWPGTPEDLKTYVDSVRADMVSDSYFYQRYLVFRPEAAVIETMKDIKGIDASITLAEQNQHYPRLNHIMYCSKMCWYSDLCANEYLKGGVNQDKRDSDYMIRDDSDIEGR